MKKLAPECSEEICAGSGHAFRSILPPVATHFATGEADFADRIGRLSDDDLRYLVDLIRDGGESLGCVPPELLSLFLQRVADRLGREQAEELVLLYAEERTCEYPDEDIPPED